MLTDILYAFRAARAARKAQMLAARRIADRAARTAARWALLPDAEVLQIARSALPGSAGGYGLAQAEATRRGLSWK